MPAIRLLTTILLVAAIFSSCQKGEEGWEPLRVVSEKTTVFERPSSSSAVVAELPFGSEVLCSEKGLGNEVTKGWLQVKSGGHRGFMEKRGVAEEGLYEEINRTFEEAGKAPIQATGETGKKVSLLLKPEIGAFVVELLREPARAEVLERVVTTSGEKEKARKQLWYRIRLANGRAGFVLKRQLRLTPPPELGAYTQVRTPVSWHSLGERVDPETGRRGSDYIVAYESFGSGANTDFTRVELYTFDPGTRQYGTALAKSGLYGILPLKIADAENGGKTIEIRQHPKGDRGKINVIRYSYPSPIKLLSEHTEEAPAR